MSTNADQGQADDVESKLYDVLNEMFPRLTIGDCYVSDGSGMWRIAMVDGELEASLFAGAETVRLLIDRDQRATAFIKDQFAMLFGVGVASP